MPLDMHAIMHAIGRPPHPTGLLTVAASYNQHSDHACTPIAAITDSLQAEHLQYIDLASPCL